MTALPVPRPTVDPGTEPFWAAARAGHLVVPWCPSCAAAFWYPRGFCPRCHDDQVEWIPGGRGTVYAATVVRQAQRAWADAAPYVVAYVELAEGPRVLTHVVDCPPEEVTVGTPVTAVFVYGPGDRGDPETPVALRFRPSASEDDQPRRR